MLYISIIDWLERHLISCSFKELIGVECPSCGTQRSLILLMKGDVIGSLKIYPALLPTFFLLVFLVLHLILKFKHGAEILKHTFVFVLTVMIFNYLLKML